MKISELIEELKRLQERHGDLQVVVQYRDEGGIYYGFDTDCEPIIKIADTNEGEQIKFVSL